MVLVHHQMKHAVLGFLPGYYFNGHQVVSTGAALPPTQHVDSRTGEIMFYVRPLFDFGPSVGMFVRLQGILDYLQSIENASHSTSSSVDKANPPETQH
jgi:hypothetical protein